MENLAVLDINGSFQTDCVDPEHSGVTGQTFHLKHVLQTHSPQNSPEAFFRLKSCELMKSGVHAPPTAFIPGLLEEQLSPIAQTSGPMMLARVASQHHLEDIRIFPLQQIEELKAVHQRHVNIQHQKIDLLLL